MRLFNVAATVFLTSAGFAAAAGKCEAQNILDTCLRTTEAEVKNCSPNDWECLCAEYTDVLTCYNNCPDDEGRFGVQSQVTANCNAAKSLSPSSSSDSGPEPSAVPDDEKTKLSGGDGGSGKGKDEPSPTESGDATTSTESAEADATTGAASGITVQAGGVIAAVLVGLGAWL